MIRWRKWTVFLFHDDLRLALAELFGETDGQSIVSHLDSRLQHRIRCAPTARNLHFEYEALYTEVKYACYTLCGGYRGRGHGVSRVILSMNTTKMRYNAEFI
jgi:hypothetical protein